MRYQVQFTLPTEPPLVKKYVNKTAPNGELPTYVFEVPINYPDAHNLGFQQLIEAAERSRLSTVSTKLNKTGVPILQDTSKRICARQITAQESR